VTPKKKDGGWWLWVWVSLAFLILIGGWTTIFVLAAQNQPEQVPRHVGKND